MLNIVHKMWQCAINNTYRLLPHVVYIIKHTEELNIHDFLLLRAAIQHVSRLHKNNNNNNNSNFVKRHFRWHTNITSVSIYFWNILFFFLLNYTFNGHIHIFVFCFILCSVFFEPQELKICIQWMQH